MINAALKTHTDVFSRKVNILVKNIAAIEREVRATGGSDEDIASMSQPYYELLKRSYLEDYPLVTAFDTSDLIVILRGEAAELINPRLSLITSYFTKIRSQVTKLTKELADIAHSSARLPREVDLGLSAYGRGSLVLGFALPPASGLDENEVGQEMLFGEYDPLYKAAKEAMRTLGVVSYHVAEGHSIEDIAKDVLDGKVRDVALSAVQEIAPTGKLGVSSVTVSGKDQAHSAGELTPQVRKAVGEALKTPAVGDEFTELVGLVREIDLDAQRFELRQVEHDRISDVRCAYSSASYPDSEATKWVNNKVSIYGKVERNSAGKARLIEVVKVRAL